MSSTRAGIVHRTTSSLPDANNKTVDRGGHTYIRGECLDHAVESNSLKIKVT